MHEVVNQYHSHNSSLPKLNFQKALLLAQIKTWPKLKVSMRLLKGLDDVTWTMVTTTFNKRQRFQSIICSISPKQ